MHIEKISEIENYRNLTGLTFNFNDILNFIIGENNVGKTNLVELINIVLSKGKFNKSDFDDTQKPIQACITLSILDDEIGFLKDFFDIDDCNKITIKLEQENPDERILYYVGEKDNEVSPSIIKNINVVYYSSQRLPNKELTFTKETGSGSILNHFIVESLKKKDYNQSDFLVKDKLDEIKDEVNDFIKKISILMNDPIMAHISEEPDNIVSKMLEIGNGNQVALSDLGDGIQYAFSIILSILDSILEKKKNRTDEKFDEALVYIGDKKYYPMIILLDEPEIHQHPSRQRLIISTVLEILQNKKNGFVEIIKDLFGIDGLVGQLFIITHSPNILLNDYKQFIRLYMDNTDIKCVCGTNVSIADSELKHLFMAYGAIKESFFCRKVLLVEGETEKGAFSQICMHKGINLDYYSSIIVEMGGANNVLPLMNIFKEFGIKVFSFLDRDQYTSYSGHSDIFFTDKIDYENEMVAFMPLKEKLEALKIYGIHTGIIKDLRTILPSIDGKKFATNLEMPPIPQSVKSQVDTIIDNALIDKMKENKNQVSTIKIIDILSSYPKSITDFLDKITE